MVNFASRRPKKLKPSTVDPDAFRRLIFEEGLRVRWQMATACPCQATDAGLGLGDLVVDPSQILASGRADCPECTGRGLVYHEPTQEPINAIFTQGRGEWMAMSPVGHYDRGFGFFSLLPEHMPGWGDRLTLLESSVRRDERFVRSSGVLQDLRYPVSTRLLDLARDGEEDSNDPNPTPVSVLHMRATVPPGQQNEGLPGAVLVEGVDFTITVSGQVDFSLAQARGTDPEPGTQVAVSYYMNPVYVIVSDPHTVRDRWRVLKVKSPMHLADPVQAMGRLEYLGPPGGLS